jgi:hypothetical protein
MSETDYSRTRAAIVEWDSYFETWKADFDKLCDSLEPGQFEKNSDLVFKHFDVGIAKLCATVGEAFVADTNGVNSREKALLPFGRPGDRTYPMLCGWVRELAA